MYGEYDPSLGPKWTMTLVHAGYVAALGWLLLGPGAAAVGLRVEATPGRRALVFAAALVYLLRLLITLFVLVRRRMAWHEAATILPWLAIVYATYVGLAAHNPAPLGAPVYAGVALYLAGSFLNTGGEYLRHLWKRRPENRGHLYTGGLFRYSRHVNYFGDAVLFTGFALIVGRWWALVIPAVMIGGFVFVNIPMLDAYLARKYPSEFDGYARRTATFVPFVY